jgi:hypothetical protein
MGEKAHVISRHPTIRHRSGNPLDVQTQEIEKFPDKYGDFSSINTIRAEE